MNVAEINRTKKPVIICVDDEQMVLLSLKSQLKRSFGNEYIIETVESGEEGIELFHDYLKKDTEIPLVISDQIMPGMKGDEFLKEVHQISQKTLKILLTGQASPEAIGNAVNYASLYRYISKPWEQTDLDLTVSEAVRCFFQSRQLEVQNRMLKEYAETLEEKIKERTREINAQKAELEIKNHDITSSINYAWRIQKSMLPASEFIKQHLPESFVLFKPRDIVSGDFYWFNAKNNKIVIIAADCTGHGVPGGFMSIISNILLNEIINKQKIYEPDVILSKLDTSIKKILKQSITQNSDGLDIAVCVYDTETKILEYAGANNPLLMINNNELTEIKADKRPIGGFWNTQDDTYNFKKVSLKIESSSCFYIFSDGFADQFGGRNNKKFLRKNLYSKLLSIHQASFSDQKEILQSVLTNWQGSQNQNDDILVMGFSLG
jgi:serine phosphatase RsbU (regulator of sigma subunit)